HYLKNTTKTWVDIEKELGDIDRRTITKLIVQNNYNDLDKIIKNELKTHIEKRHSLEQKQENDVKLSEMVDVIIHRGCNFIKNGIRKENVTVKKTKMYFTTQKHNDIKTFERFFKISDIKQGIWNIDNNVDNI